MGYEDVVGQSLIATTMRWFTRAAYWFVLMRIFGMRRFTGSKRYYGSADPREAT